MHVLMGVAGMIGGLLGLVLAFDGQPAGTGVLVSSTVLFSAAAVMAYLRELHAALVWEFRKNRLDASGSATPDHPAAPPAPSPFARAVAQSPADARR